MDGASVNTKNHPTADVNMPAARAVSDAELLRLLDEQEINRALTTYCHGIDRGDADLMLSVYHAGATDYHGRFKGSASEFVTDVLPRMRRYRATMHRISNVLIEFDGDSAFVQSYVVAAHVLERDGASIIEWLGGRYLDGFERRDNVWKIAHRLVVLDWEAEQQVSRQPYAGVPFTVGSRSTEDPAYAFLRGGVFPKAEA
jgi:SnoaL-like domain